LPAGDFSGFGPALEACSGQREVALTDGGKLLVVFDGDSCSDELLKSGANFVAAGGNASARQGKDCIGIVKLNQALDVAALSRSAKNTPSALGSDA